jgi:hypothetical protein
MDEIDTFLALTDSSLFIDHFCFDTWLHVHTEFVPVKVSSSFPWSQFVSMYIHMCQAVTMGTKN